jgi:serine/threonine-protein kinase
MSDLDARVEVLRREGQHEEAAELCLAAGEIERASELFADVWQYDRAIEVAEAAGLFALAYRHSLTAGARDATRRVIEALADRPEQALEAAAHAEAKNRIADAARLFELAGNVARAAGAYERSGELFEAARLREAQGQYREAGLLYERRVRESPDDGEAALRLGRVLAHYGRFEHAVRALQIAADDPDRRAAALRLMIACFAALGLMDAAASQLDELRRDDPSLPLTVPEFLEERFGDERGIAGLGASDGNAEQEGRLLAGRYRILRPLGAGATGRVLLARDGFYERDVAVKVLTVGSGTAGRDAFVRFAREARVAAGLEHPNVVRVYDFNPDGPFLVMEHMPGGTLEDRLQRDDTRGALVLPLSVIRHVLVSVLAGLEAVHRRGVVHRDLKPANVFFGATGDVKIGDFGVAHLADLGATLTGAMLGTLAYMAPEQITGSGKPAASTDLYALGVILHRLLTGTLPFPGPDFVTQHLSQPAPKPSEEGAPSTTYDALVESLLAKDPVDRPQTAADLLAAIEALSWEDDGTAALVQAHDESASAQRPSSVPPPPADRYVPIEPLADGSQLARDGDLGRTVLVTTCTLERAELLRVLSRADGPHLQAIYDIDPETGRAILEHPRGRLLADLAPTPEQRARIVADIERALATLHAASLAHGEVTASKIRVADGRAVLLLPDMAHEPTERDRDLADLDRLRWAGS